MYKNNNIYFLFKLLFLFNLFLFFDIPITAYAANQYSFQEAKKQARIIWSENRITAYCGCKYNKKLLVKFHTCTYKPQDIRRASKVEWEHIVPASWFGHSRDCWKKPICKKKNGQLYKGRKCCELIDKEFRQMHSDLHNLVPIIGEVNAARSAYTLTELSIEEKNRVGPFNHCNIFISNSTKTVEPRDEIKGLVARAHLYMVKSYQVKLNNNQKIIIDKWNRLYPPSEWEIIWNQKIKAYNGTDNSYISEYKKNIINQNTGDLAFISPIQLFSIGVLTNIVGD
jgi:deoxyribonuclease-1